MKIQKITELVSLGLTPSTVILSLLVVLVWGRPALSILIRAPKTAQCWFIIGVFFGFLGGSVDNIYWGIAWTTEYLDVDPSKWWFRHGVYCNVPARQLSGTLAAYCHIRSACEFESDSRLNKWLSMLTLGSLGVGLLFVCALYVIKSTL